MKASFLSQLRIRIGALICLISLVTSVCRSQIFVFNQNGFAGDAAVGEYNFDGTAVNANLITGLNSSGAIAVSGTNLFLGASVSSGTLGEYTTSGTPITPSLITGLGGGAPETIVVSGSYLFFADDVNDKVSEYTTSGAVVNASLITGLNKPVAVALSGSKLFVLDNGNGTVGEYTLGATPGTVTSSSPSLITGFSVNLAFGLAVSGPYLFVASAGGTGTIGEYTTSGATVNASLLTGLGSGLSSIALSGPYLFVANDTPGTISKYALGATPGTLTSSNVSLITGLYEPYHIAVVSPSSPIINVRKAVYLTSTNLIVGYNYQIQASSDLINWTNQGSVFSATNSNWQSTNYWDVDDWNDLFFQLEVVP